MPEPDIVTNSSPFGSRYSIDKQVPDKQEDVIEKVQSTPSPPPKKKPPKVKKNPFPVIMSLMVVIGLLAAGAWALTSRSRLASMLSQESSQRQSISSDQETNDSSSTPSLFSNPLDGTRHFIAVGLVIVTFVLSVALIMIVMKKSLEAIGRNPMAARHVKQSLFLAILALLAIIGVGLAIAYFLFYGNPPPNTSRIVIPTPPPSLPEGAENTVFTTNCLNVSVPFKTTYPKLALREDRCTLTFNVTTPPGDFTLTYRSQPEHALEADPSITMRRVYTDKYTEFSFSHPRYPRVLAFKTDTEQTYVLRDQEDHHFELTFHGFQAGYESVITPDIIYFLIDSIQLPLTPREETLGVDESL
jgi:hypothetical protein